MQGKCRSYRAGFDRAGTRPIPDFGWLNASSFYKVQKRQRPGGVVTRLPRRDQGWPGGLAGAAGFSATPRSTRLALKTFAFASST